jgi:hypothetical protein
MRAARLRRMQLKASSAIQPPTAGASEAPFASAVMLRSYCPREPRPPARPGGSAPGRKSKAAFPGRHLDICSFLVSDAGVE